MFGRLKIDRRRRSRDVRPRVSGSVQLPLDRIQAEFTAPGPELRRLNLSFKKWPRKSLVSGSANCDGPKPSWLRKSLVSGTAGLGEPRGGSSWLRKSLVSGSVGRDASELDRGWSTVDWCGPVDDAGVNIRDGGGGWSGFDGGEWPGFGAGAEEWSVGRELGPGGDQKENGAGGSVDNVLDQ
jgi:hypothetical protein